MNKTTEALKLAEEALGNLIGWMDANKFVVLPKERKNLAAIREALAEPVQEPVASVVAILDKCISIIGTEMVRCKQAGDKWFMCQRFIHAIQDMQYEFKRDYPAPVSAKREWVDLTDDEIWEAVKNWNLKERVEGNYSLTRAVIAKFKDKNK